jgi:AraC family transcriptional regulator
MAGRVLCHEPPVGSLAIGPAGIDCAGDADGTFEFLFVGIDPAWLALAAAEGSERQAQLIECFWGYDHSLLALARTLAFEGADGYPNGPLFWNEVASRFIDQLAVRHMSALPVRARGMLSSDALKRIKEYVVAHLDEPIEVAALAGIAARSPFHFTRVFTQAVGLTPHRYVIHLRLRRAVELLRDGRLGLAEIAACTGFADQSHLSRWVRRVHGVSLTQLTA